MAQNMDTLYIETSQAISTAESMKSIAESIITTLNEIKAEMDKVDQEDEALYFNTGSGSKPAAFKAELEANASRFNTFKEQIDAFADFVIDAANSAEQN